MGFLIATESMLGRTYVSRTALPTVSQIDLIATYHFNLEEVDATTLADEDDPLSWTLGNVVGWAVCAEAIHCCPATKSTPIAYL